MSLYDDNPSNPQNQDPLAQATSDIPAESSTEPVAAPLSGSPVSWATPTESPDSKLPEDLRISWSWVHLLVFGAFVVSSLITLQLVVIFYLSADRHLSQNQLKKLFESDPRLIIGLNVLWFGLILFFLYITLGVLRDSPFWQSLGWRKFKSDPDSGENKGRPWIYFLSGCGLSIFVALASSRVKEADNAPIQEFLKNRTGAFLLMAMAVLIAPLVEETVFRGYLYPVLARITSAVLQSRGMEFSIATRAGVVTSILVTGTLFGLMHAPQLGWTWGLVSLLTLVGVIFTFARAWTGTVLASFLLHLGYNSMIAFTSIVATKGFTHIPPHP